MALGKKDTDLSTIYAIIRTCDKHGLIYLYIYTLIVCKCISEYLSIMYMSECDLMYMYI